MNSGGSGMNAYPPNYATLPLAIVLAVGFIASLIVIFVGSKGK